MLILIETFMVATTASILDFGCGCSRHFKAFFVSLVLLGGLVILPHGPVAIRMLSRVDCFRFEFHIFESKSLIEFPQRWITHYFPVLRWIFIARKRQMLDFKSNHLHLSSHLHTLYLMASDRQTNNGINCLHPTEARIGKATMNAIHSNVYDCCCHDSIKKKNGIIVDLQWHSVGELWSVSQWVCQSVGLSVIGSGV